MNQPTEDRIKRLEEEQRQLKAEVRQLREQMTEPIKITRLEIDSGSMHKRLDAVQEDTNVLKIEMQGARADISNIKATQSDHSAFFIEHSQRLENIEQKQEAHTEILGQIMNFGERIEGAMATKDDISRLEGRIDEQGDLLKLILAELRKRRGEE
jgi:regulator of replication initiation timing